MPLNPYEPPQEKCEPQKRKPFPWLEIFLWLGLVAVVVALMLPAIFR